MVVKRRGHVKRINAAASGNPSFSVGHSAPSSVLLKDFGADARLSLSPHHPASRLAAFAFVW